MSLIACLMAIWLFGVKAIQIFYNWYRLKHIPGSFWISSTKLWQIATQMRGNWYLEVRKLGDKHGKLVRIGPNQLLTTDVDVIRRMAHSKSSYTRAPFYQTFRFIPTQDNSFSLIDDVEHTRLRTSLGPGYVGNEFVESCVDNQCSRLVNLIEKKFISTPGEYKPLDLTKVSFFFAMDCVGDLSFGRAFGCLDEGEDVHKFVKWNEDFFNIAILISNFHWLTKIFFKHPFNKIYPSALDKDGVGKYIALAQEAVKKSYDEGQGRLRDTLSSFIEQGITKDEAINELMLQVVAGTDSTATAIRMTMLFLVTSPSAYSKLKSEISEAISKGTISSPIKDAESRKLPYLQAVIKEGLRAFPVVTATFFKKVPKGGDFINGYFVPEGTEVGHNVMGIMRAEQYWGKDADVFRPERWLEADEETYEMMTGVLETLWGSGRYKCLGRAIAQVELNKVFVELLRRFDFSVVTPQDPVKIVNSGFFLMSEIKMRVTKSELIKE
ncbi:cytochrome P450 [Annulohypoxylon maeteangense]|uniref:cytochrome P450 n=1 Tax=Annulohypoxylon maeteangense TaxID=1927788 RepID=UPI002008E486|nr:cytochrome P450 [Annulohypoxylon maeteangense]KAI0890288.1 cytochrome P450 [Annulohypoxylon maeteangense]